MTFYAANTTSDNFSNKWLHSLVTFEVYIHQLVNSFIKVRVRMAVFFWNTHFV